MFFFYAEDFAYFLPAMLVQVVGDWTPLQHYVQQKELPNFFEITTTYFIERFLE